MTRCFQLNNCSCMSESATKNIIEDNCEVYCAVDDKNTFFKQYMTISMNQKSLLFTDDLTLRIVAA